MIENMVIFCLFGQKMFKTLGLGKTKLVEKDIKKMDIVSLIWQCF